MGRSVYRLICFISIALVIGCDRMEYYDSNYTPSANLYYLKPSDSRFDYEKSSAHQVVFTIESMDTKWKLINSNDWFTLSPSTGEKTEQVTIDIQENPSGEKSRMGIFELQSAHSDWTYNQSMTVSQMASSPFLTIEDDYLYYGGGAEQKTITIETNCEWTPSTNDNWLVVEKVHNDLIVTAEPNIDNSYRYADIKISYQRTYKSIRIVQYPAKVTVSDLSLSCENTASDMIVSVNSEADWTSTVSNSWISVTPSSGNAGAQDIKISVTPNASVSSRKGYVTFFIGHNKRTQIEITQRGFYIESSIDKLDFSSKVQSTNLNIYSNTSWTIESFPEWVSLSVQNGDGNGTVKITTEENHSVDPRTGELVITKEALNISSIVQITQKGKKFSLENSYMEFPHYASSQVLKLNSELQWKSFVSQEWISTNPLSGDTGGLINVSVLDNNTYEERDGNVTFMVNGKSSTLAVHQQSKYFTIENKVFNFNSQGGSVNITFGTNEKWNITVENSPEWVLLSDNEGAGDGNVLLSVADNPSVKSRTATVDIITETGRIYRIPISQSSRYLRANTQSISFFAHGGNIDFTVETDGNYKVYVSDTWINVYDNSNGNISVTTDINDKEEPRRGMVTIELTDLKDGEMKIIVPVIQLGHGLSFVKNEYLVDEDWNDIGYNTFILSIKHFSNDVDWNSAFDNSMEIIKNTYSNDIDWNTSIENSNDITIDDFGNDSEWNESADNNISINQNGYEE